MSSELVDLEQQSKYDENAFLGNKLAYGNYDQYLCLNNDMWNDARIHLFDPNYKNRDFMGLPKLKYKEVQFIDDIFRQFKNANHGNVIKSPIDDPRFLMDIANDVRRNQYPLNFDEYNENELRIKDKIRFRRNAGIPFWKKLYYRGNKIADNAVKEIPQMVTENIVPNYKGDYLHGKYGYENAPKLPGDKYIKKAGQFAGHFNSIANFANAAAAGWEAGLGVVDAVRNAVRVAGEKYLEDKPNRWAVERAQVRDIERQGGDLNKHKVILAIEDKAAYAAKHMDDSKPISLNKYLKNVLTKDPVSQAKQETYRYNTDKSPTKKGMSGPKAVGGFSTPMNSFYNGSYRKVHRLRSYYTNNWRRRRYFKKNKRYYKKYKRYGRIHSKYFFRKRF